MARSAGTSVQLVAKEGNTATLRLPSTEMRRVAIDCIATIGEVGNSEYELIQIGKAGRSRWKGTAVVRARPVVVATRCHRGASRKAGPERRARNQMTRSSAVGGLVADGGKGCRAA